LTGEKARVPMPSSRLPPDLTPNATTRALSERRRAGARILDLTESNPTRVGIAYPDDLLQPLADTRGLAYDPEPLGMIAAREAIARDWARRGLAIDAANVALTASTSEAYSLLFKLLCDPGDAVLVPRPSYPLFEHLTRLEAVEALAYELDYHGAWRIDGDRIRRLLTPRVKAVLIVSPNNPTGSFLHRDDLAMLVTLLAEHHTVLIGDEVFADYPLDPAPDACSVLAQHDVPAFALGGLSKSVGLPQVKLGWLTLGGPPNLVRELLTSYEVIADTYLSVSTAVQIAAPALLERGATVRAAIQQRVSHNLQMLRAAVRECPTMTVLDVEGGWSAVVQVPTTQTEEALVLQLLTEHGVLVHPGFFFDFPRESFLIISLLVEPAVFDEAVSALTAHIRGALRG
jgi:alanine-synthesizing transaminase